MASRNGSGAGIKAILGILLITGAALPANGAATIGLTSIAENDGCMAPATLVPHVGLACPLANGLLLLLSEDGLPMGTTHGADSVPAEAGRDTAWWPSRQPVCVDADTSTHYMQVIYAVADDRPDRFDSTLEDFRSLIRKANGAFDWAAMRSGVHADLRVACRDGNIDIAHVVLPFASSGARFESIVTALQSVGYNRSTLKYWVVYDGEVAGIGGQGHIRDDSRLAADNANNGGDAMFAISYGFSDFVLLHELGHNLGAVQRAAPHRTGGWHCTDGLDVMCYEDALMCPSDGLQTGLCVDTAGVRPQYTTTACGFAAMDCNQDDYFHAAPPVGNYLATHWNLASRLNNYVRFDGVPIGPPECLARLTPKDEAACTVSGGNPDGSLVQFTVDWGDGSSTETSDFVAAGLPVAFGHRFDSAGDYVVTFHAIELESSRTSEVIRRTILVREEWAPEALAVACPSFQSNTSPVECTMTAHDLEGDLLRYMVDWGDGLVEELPAHGGATPGEIVVAQHDYETEGVLSITVKAIETKKPHLETSSEVLVLSLYETDQLGPAIVFIDPAPRAVYEACNRVDVPSGAGTSEVPVFLGVGCVRLAVADDFTGVTSVRVQMPAACPGEEDVTVLAPEGAIQITYVVCHQGDFPVVVTAIDGLGNEATSAVIASHVPSSDPTAQQAIATATGLAQTAANLVLSCIPSDDDPNVDCNGIL